jgi:enolase
VKTDQIGTISETLDVVVCAKHVDFPTVISARSGETEDDALADLAVGSRGGQIKVGSVTPSERLAK